MTLADTTRVPQTIIRGDGERHSDAELSKKSIDATAGGGLIQVRIDGHRALRSLKIAPEAFDGRDADLLADLIMAAISEAQRRLDDNG